MSIYLIFLNYLSYLSNLVEITYYLKNKFLLLEPSPSSSFLRENYFIFSMLMRHYEIW